MSEATNTSKIVKILKSIEKKLDVLSRIVGYLSIFLFTPVFFILSYFGIGYQDLLGIKELTPAQKEITQQLAATGHKPDQTGAENALNSNDPVFTEYLKAEMYPRREVGLKWVSTVFSQNTVPAFNDNYMRGYLNNFPDVSNEIAEKFKVLEDFLRAATSDTDFEKPDEFCSKFPFLNNGDFQYPHLGKTVSCLDSFKTGTTLMYFEDAVSSYRYWSKFLGKPNPRPITDDQLLKIADLTNAANVDELPLTTEDALRNVSNWQVFRVITDAKNYDGKTPVENYTRQLMIFKINDGNLGSPHTISMEVIDRNRRADLLGPCIDTCRVDLTAVRIGEVVYGLKAEISGRARDRNIAYSSY